MNSPNKKPNITVIMPVYNAVRFLEMSLSPLLNMMSRGEVFEVIVVDDHSTDYSGDVASKCGARVLNTKRRSGPGAARNVGAKLAGGDILWFVDADVIVHLDAASKLIKEFSDPTVTAVFGCYDDKPPAQNFLSQYKNLVHRYYHHQGNREASTFWAGCGAVRTSQFFEVGGFDMERYDRPSIEDIDLGYRLRAWGRRIVLNPTVQGTHLKQWTFLNLIRTEIVQRAIPWSRLMLHESHITNDLNVTFEERLRAILACLIFVLLIVVFFGIAPWWVLVFGLVTIFAFNWQLTRFFYKRKGLLFAVGAVLFHQLYYLYSTAAFIWVWLGHHSSKVPNH